MSTKYKWAFRKPSKFGRFVENAQRPAKIPLSLRIHRSHALRGPASFSAILQIAQPSLLPPTSGSLAALQSPKLSRCGSLSGSSVCDRSWDWTRRELWWLPPHWAKHASRNVLWLPAKYPRWELYVKIQTTASKVKPTIKRDLQHF